MGVVHVLRASAVHVEVQVALFLILPSLILAPGPNSSLVRELARRLWLRCVVCVKART